MAMGYIRLKGRRAAYFARIGAEYRKLEGKTARKQIATGRQGKRWDQFTLSLAFNPMHC